MIALLVEMTLSQSDVHWQDTSDQGVARVRRVSEGLGASAGRVAFQWTPRTRGPSL